MSEAAQIAAKTARLEARLTDEQKALFQHAADLTGRSLTEFVVSSAQEAAARTVREHEVLTCPLAAPVYGQAAEQCSGNQRHRAVLQSAEIAAAAVVVDAIDAGAAKFYGHFGCVAFPAIAGCLFLPMKAIAGLFR
ncbi:MAG TPA: DUF1778 domain-containing protein [Bryobacteraceae bacterium]|nr:DUF1778 domain-containing protein [Bryobacteraceae bacterium]